MVPAVWRPLLLAATAAERVAAGTSRPLGDGRREAGKRRLNRWRSAAYHDPRAFSDWSRTLGLDEAGWESLLGMEAAEIAGPFDQLPDWARWLSRALDEDRRPAPTPTSPPAAPEGLLLALEPLVAAAIRELGDRVGRLSTASGRSAEGAPLGALLAATWPRARLARIVLRVFVLEMHVARLNGRLAEGEGRRRFEAFVSSLRDPEVGQAILLKYPVAARHCERELRGWVLAREEFARHLLQDAEALAGRVPGLDVAGIEQIAFEKGDSHRGGRSVAIVAFASGARVVYKPRSLEVDERFQELLAWTAARGFAPELRSCWVLARGDHGWMEYLLNRPCRDRAELGRFYRRQGACLALLHVLHARDLHRENVIADGEHPFLIDLEGLFHAEPARVEDEAGADAAVTRRLISATVMATGLLPNPRSAAPEAGVGRTDFSGLSEQDQLSPEEVMVWDGTGTDAMRMVRRRVSIGPSQNLPALDGRAVTIREHGDDFEAGFRDMYQLLMRHREELLAADGRLARFAPATVRVLLRSTQTYSNVLDQIYHPDLLRNALDRDHYLSQVFASPTGLVGEDLIVASERAQLDAADVPIFTARVAGTDIVGGDGTTIPGALASSGLEAVFHRVQALSAADLEQQVWVIRAALSTMGLDARRPQWPVHRVPWPESAAGAGAFLEAAVGLAEDLLGQAVRVGEDLGWLGIQFAEHRDWQLAAIGGDLYGGSSGLALFFAYAGAVTGDRRFAEAADRIAHSLAARLARMGRAAGGGQTAPGGVLGMSGGIDGSLYMLSHWAVLRDDRGLVRDTFEAVAPLIATALDEDSALDVVGGAAGTALVLDAVASVVPLPAVLELLERAAARLCAAARRDGGQAAWPLARFEGRALTGMSHGASGMALALARAGRRTGRAGDLELARAALEFERARFDPELPGWPDHRPGAEAAGTTTAWCHGAPGIGCVRASLAGWLGDEQILQDLRTAVDATLAHYRRCREAESIRLNNFSLCHGELGNNLFLQLAARRLADGPLALLADQHAHAILMAARQSGWSCGVPQGLSSPGLMTGLAGMGLGLLRLAAPSRVPCVLTLEPPLSADAETA